MKFESLKLFCHLPGFFPLFIWLKFIYCLNAYCVVIHDKVVCQCFVYNGVCPTAEFYECFNSFCIVIQHFPFKAHKKKKRGVGAQVLVYECQKKRDLRHNIQTRAQGRQAGRQTGFLHKALLLICVPFFLSLVAREDSLPKPLGSLLSSFSQWKIIPWQKLSFLFLFAKRTNEARLNLS